MSYTEQTWASGDIITAEKLNHMEDGIAGAGGVFSVPTTFDEASGTVTCTKTWKEIYDAMVSGKICILHSYSESNCHIDIVFAVNSDFEGVFEVSTFNGSNALLYVTDSENGYPSYVDD